MNFAADTGLSSLLIEEATSLTVYENSGNSFGAFCLAADLAVAIISLPSGIGDQGTKHQRWTPIPMNIVASSKYYAQYYTPPNLNSPSESPPPCSPPNTAPPPPPSSPSCPATPALSPAAAP